MLYIVTACHNRKKITEKFVEKLIESVYQDFILVLVDDGSDDGTDIMVKSMLNEKVVILYGDGNLWWAGALEKARRWLCQNANDNDLVLISNDDVSYDTDYLFNGVDLIKGKENTLLLGLAYSNVTGKLEDAPINWNYMMTEGQRIDEEPYSGNCASTRSLFMHVIDLKKIGAFHPVLLPHYMSDYEWTIRAYRKGYKITSNSHLRYVMNEETTGYKDRKSVSLKQIFSKKSNMNPFYRLSFIFLTVPLYQVPYAIFNQIKRIVS